MSPYGGVCDLLHEGVGFSPQEAVSTPKVYPSFNHTHHVKHIQLIETQ